MNKINYQKELERLIDKLPDHHRRLFLHSCCVRRAPATVWNICGSISM